MKIHWTQIAKEISTALQERGWVGGSVANEWYLLHKLKDLSNPVMGNPDMAVCVPFCLWGFEETG